MFKLGNTLGTVRPKFVFLNKDILLARLKHQVDLRQNMEHPPNFLGRG